MPAAENKLSTAEKLAYGLGDAGANLIFQTQITFLLYFYTNVLGISSAVAGTILLASRVIDICSDPIAGALADRTRSRWGRFRPWILASAVPLAITFVLCYSMPGFGYTGKVIWAIATYNLLMLMYAANHIPYCALGGVMTSNSEER